MNKLEEIKREVENWIAQQGHNSCWYYPDIFNNICRILDIEAPDRGLPPEKEFEVGCEKFRKEIYVQSHRSVSGNDTDSSSKGCSE